MKNIAWCSAGKLHSATHVMMKCLLWKLKLQEK